MDKPVSPGLLSANLPFEGPAQISSPFPSPWPAQHTADPCPTHQEANTLPAAPEAGSGLHSQLFTARGKDLGWGLTHVCSQVPGAGGHLLRPLARALFSSWGFGPRMCHLPKKQHQGCIPGPWKAPEDGQQCLLREAIPTEVRAVASSVENEDKLQEKQTGQLRAQPAQGAWAAPALILCSWGCWGGALSPPYTLP